MAGHDEPRERRERWLQTAAFFGALLVLGAVLYLAFVVQGNRPAEVKESTAAPVLATVRTMPSVPMAPAATPYPRLQVTSGVPDSSPYPPLIIPTPAPPSTPLLSAGEVRP